MSERVSMMVTETEKVRLEDEILNRGVVDIITSEGLRNRLEQAEPLRIKYGIDPTMQSAHIGHATPIRKLRQFQELGHTAVFVIGDYTARIGDPTGKSATRVRLTPEEVKSNAQRYFEQAYKILDKDKTEIHMQSEWYSKITLEELIDLMAKTNYGRIMSHETFAVRVREGQQLGFHEMLYPVLQAYDSVMLKADVELGGADQRFNFVLTRDIQKAFGQAPEEVILTQYLPGVDGNEKMSKSLGNTIDLLASPGEMYAKIMSIRDELMGRFFELGTDIPMPEVRDLLKKLESGGIGPLELKKMLARSITALYHTAEEVDKAEDAFKKLTQDKQAPDEVPIHEISEDSVDLVVFLQANGYVKSKSEARRLISQNGISVDGKPIDLESATSFSLGSEHSIKVGKRVYLRIVKK